MSETLIPSIALLVATFLFPFIISCDTDKPPHSASGTFEATEIVVSAEAAGKIEQFALTEGDYILKDKNLGFIDTAQLHLKKSQLEATIKAIASRRPDISVQISATKDQIAKAEIDKKRVENMFTDSAATQKQLDDINTQLAVLKSTLAAQVSSLSKAAKGVDDESEVYKIQIEQINDQIRKSLIINPIEGHVINKYAEEKEITAQGKPLYRIADTKHLFLRAYITSDQLEKIKIGQKATIFINVEGGAQKQYDGKVTWISDKAEFTPKTIQTIDERRNLVYAIKIAVENSDGGIKIGMYGDADF